MLSPRDDFYGTVPVEEPAHEIDVVREDVHHGCGMRIALQNRERLRARVVNACESADDFPQPPLDHLFLRTQEALLEAPAVADAELPVRPAQRLDDPVGVITVERDRLLDQHRLAELERPYDRRGVLALRRRDEDGVDFRPLDDFEVVRGGEIRAGLPGERGCLVRVQVGDREKSDARMPGGEARAQRADAAGADHRDAECSLPVG